jgi:thymidylate kinase
VVVTRATPTGHGLDVVSRLADHQANLVPPAAVHRAAVLALPMPSIVEALGREVFARVRARTLAAAAAALGGGEGPAPVCDLEADGRALDVVLSELGAQGVELLAVAGAADHAPLARAVAFRWAGGLRVLGGEARGVLFALMDDPAPVRWLEPGVARVRDGATPPAEARVVFRAVGEREAPDDGTTNGGGHAEVRCYALDPERAGGAWAGFLPPSALAGGCRAEARARWLAHWEARGRGAMARWAALGVDPLTEARLATGAASPEAARASESWRSESGSEASAFESAEATTGECEVLSHERLATTGCNWDEALSCDESGRFLRVLGNNTGPYPVFRTPGAGDAPTDDLEYQTSRGGNSSKNSGEPVGSPGGERSDAGGARRAAVFAVTGVDGSGKTTRAGELVAALAARGYAARALKIYRQGAFLTLANELGARTRRGAPLAAFRASRVVKMVDSLRAFRDAIEPALHGLDALVMDRYTETHVAAAGAQLEWDVRDHPVLQVFPQPDRAFWLRVPVEDALARLAARGEELSADEHAAGLAGYACFFDALAQGPTDVVLDARAAPEQNAARLRDEALSVLASRAGGRGARAATGPSGRGSEARPADATSSPAVNARAGAAGAGRAARRAVVLGRGAADAPGSDVLALRDFLGARLGATACGVPEAFWLEAYAAQLVLDLRGHDGPEPVAVPLWPAALRRMSGFADLPMLDEFDRLLGECARVVACDPLPQAVEAVFAGLGATPAAAARLSAEYGAALWALALERGYGALPAR